jgi:peptidoglycan/xylan/chitin deacetylase (PgdA/CDA1 family)
MLSDAGAKATFYVVGENVQKNPEILRSTADAGFQIGNHTWSHPDLTKLSKAKIKSQLSRTDKVIEETIGEKPTTLRAPFGANNAKVREAVDRPMVHWSVDTLDWKHRDPAQTIETVTKETRPGDIVLMHDIHKTTVDAVPAVIEDLQSRGFKLVTIDELFGSRKLPAGKVTNHNRGAYKP